MLGTLDTLLAVERSPESIVAYRGKQALTLGMLRQDVARLAHWLRQQPGPKPGVPSRWALCFTDSYHFAVALLACGYTGCHVVLPGHHRPAQLLALAPHFDAVLSDTLQPDGVSVPLYSWPSAAAFEGETPRLPDWPGPLGLTLFTSGSTGEPKAIIKRQQQLEAEVVELYRLWQRELQGCVVRSTVAHHHIYGLLFRLLLPLCAALPFEAEDLAFPEQLLAAVDGKTWWLISSPAFLSRLDPALTASGCAGIVSSGGALGRPAAQLAAALYGVWPIEIYGSSETGGVAWRRQQGTEPHWWSPLPGVRLSVDETGALQVRSRFLPDAAYWQTADRVELGAEGFLLLGRQDRIVKLAEKRVSLDEIEQRLCAHEWITQAAALVLESPRRSEVAVVVTLTAEGDQHWQRLGQGRFLIQLRQALRPYLEAVALPRRIRRLESLPLNAQGKRPYLQFKELFYVAEA